MHTKYTNREIWKVAYPILISLIMEQLIGMTDTAFMGRVGEVELGASAIAGVYYLAIFMLGFGFSIGSQILIARRNGEGNFRMIGPIFYQGIYFLLVMALVMFTLSRLFSPWILSHVVASPRVCEAAVSYINWRVFGFFFSFVAIMFRAFFVGTTQTKTLTLNSIVMVMSNVVFNYILVFGKLGFPALGIAGAAIGSSLAELVSMLFFIIYTTRRIDCARYGLNQLVSFRWTELKRIMNVSLWTMIQNAISISTWFLFFIFIEHLGERSLAITNIVRNVSSIPFMTITAFASTCSSLVSNLIGSGEARYVMPTIRQHVQLCTFDYDAMTVVTGDETLVLPKKEFLLLYKLAASPGRTFTKQQLMDEVWGYETEADPHTIEVHIGRIRERFKENPDFEIVTMRGLGYKVVKK